MDKPKSEPPSPLAEAPLFGLLVRLKVGHDQLPVMEMVAMPGIEREKAKIIAMLAVTEPQWYGPAQVIFMRPDGSLELWDRELREGWPNAKLRDAGESGAEQH